MWSSGTGCTNSLRRRVLAAVHNDADTLLTVGASLVRAASMSDCSFKECMDCSDRRLITTSPHLHNII